MMERTKKTEATPTCEQVANMRMLAQTLDKVATEYPEHFSMLWYRAGKLDPTHLLASKLLDDYDIDSHDQGVHPRDCGTSGCALGWAPYATGVPLKSKVVIAVGDDGRKVTGRETFEDYSQRVFGVAEGTEDFEALFLDYSEPSRGPEGARRAAQRIWEWVERWERECEES